MENNNKNYQNKLVKVRFNIQNYGSSDSFIESVWAEYVKSNIYRLDNSPFYAYGYSYNDLVKTKLQESDLFVEGVKERSGHSTFRILLKKGVSMDKFNNYWGALEELGCSYEQARENLFSVDVPKGIDVGKVLIALKKGERERVWEYEEGHVYKKI